MTVIIELIESKRGTPPLLVLNNYKSRVGTVNKSTGSTHW